MSVTSANTTFWAVFPGLTSSEPGFITPSAADKAKDPDQLDPKIFLQWIPSEQRAYITAKGGTSGSVAIGTGADAVTFSLSASYTPSLTRTAADGSTVEFRPQGTKTATATELAGTPTASQFLQWRPEDQAAWLRTRSGSTYTFTDTQGRTAFVATAVPDVEAKAGVIQNTRGDFEPLPYLYLNGSSTGLPSAVIGASANALFPVIDGEDRTLPVEERPSQFYNRPGDLDTDAKKKAFLEEFATWHSGYQLEYVKLFGTGTNKTIDISLNSGERLTATVSASDSNKLILVQSLDKAGFAKLTSVEQLQVSGLAAFAAVATSLGLVTKTTAAVPSVTGGASPVTAETAIQQLKDYMTGKSRENRDSAVETRLIEDSNATASLNAGRTADQIANGYEWIKTGATFPGIRFVNGQIEVYTQHQYALYQNKMPDADRSAFSRQLDVMVKQLSGMGVVSPKDINTKLTELKERFDRAFAFFDVKNPTVTYVNMNNPDVSVPTYRDVISTDDTQTVRNGYKIFIAQETRVAEQAEARYNTAAAGTAYGKRLDAPTLVYLFQSSYNQQGEAMVTLETEEINQQNALLKTYAMMQDAINQTLSKFEKAGDDKKKRIYGLNVDDYATMDDLRRKILGMFEDQLGTGQKHPLERLRNISRPLDEIFAQKNADDDQNYDLPERFQNAWNQFGTRLSETVTLINQNSQIKMNDINSMDKQRNRHFELANSALSKMNDMIQQIARI